MQSALFMAGASVVNRRDPRIIENEAKWGLIDVKKQASRLWKLQNLPAAAVLISSSLPRLCVATSRRSPIGPGIKRPKPPSARRQGQRYRCAQGPEGAAVRPG